MAPTAEINWELFIGLFLPAFGVWQAWLIKIAREDHDLYKLVRKQTKKMCIASITAILLIGAAFKFTANELNASWIVISNVSGVIILALSVTLSSLPFYDAVMELPPKKKN